MLEIEAASVIPFPSYLENNKPKTHIFKFPNYKVAFYGKK